MDPEIGKIGWAWLPRGLGVASEKIISRTARIGARVHYRLGWYEFTTANAELISPLQREGDPARTVAAGRPERMNGQGCAPWAIKSCRLPKSPHHLVSPILKSRVFTRVVPARVPRKHTRPLPPTRDAAFWSQLEVAGATEPSPNPRLIGRNFGGTSAIGSKARGSSYLASALRPGPHFRSWPAPHAMSNVEVHDATSPQDRLGRLFPQLEEVLEVLQILATPSPRKTGPRGGAVALLSDEPFRNAAPVHFAAIELVESHTSFTRSPK